MDTKIYLWSMDGSVDFDKSIEFNGFVQQIEAYFNKFGHLPKKGDMVNSDPGSNESGKVFYIDVVEYRGIEDNTFVIGISITTDRM